MMEDYWKGKRVLVTGGTGFIGSWLIADLLNRGAKVTCISSSIPSKESNFSKLGLKENVNMIIRDLSNTEPALIKDDLIKEKIEIVFHLAGQAILSKAMQEPFNTLKLNVLGSARILEAARITENKLRAIVLCSSINAYGGNGDKIHNEEDPLKGELPYEVSMSAQDMISQSYAKTFNLPVGIARLSNVYGPGDLAFNRLIPITIKNILSDNPIELRNNGKTQRCFLYVEDLVNGMLSLAEKIEEKKIIGEAFNFGPEKSNTIEEVVNYLVKLSNKPYDKLKLVSSKEGERGNQFLDVTKAKKILNWSAQTDIKEGLAETFKWYSNYLESQK